MCKSEVVCGLQGHRVTRLFFSLENGEQRGHRYNKNAFTLVQQLVSSARKLLQKKAGGTPSVFSTVAALCKIAHWAFNTTGAAVINVVGALYGG